MPDNNGKTATDLLDRVLLGKPDETKAKVLELVLRLGISPEDELFLVMIALGQLQVLVEGAPNDWQALFVEFRGELAEWSEINLETLGSLIRKAEHEQILAEVSSKLVTTLLDLTAYSKELLTRLDKLPQPYNDSKLTSHLQEQSVRLRSIEAQQRTTTERLTRLSQTMNQKSNDKPALPYWAALLLGGIALFTFWNNAMLGGIQQRLNRQRTAMLHHFPAHSFDRVGDRPPGSVTNTEPLFHQECTANKLYPSAVYRLNALPSNSSTTKSSLAKSFHIHLYPQLICLTWNASTHPSWQTCASGWGRKQTTPALILTLPPCLRRAPSSNSANITAIIWLTS